MGANNLDKTRRVKLLKGDIAAHQVATGETLLGAYTDGRLALKSDANIVKSINDGYDLVGLDTVISDNFDFGIGDWTAVGANIVQDTYKGNTGIRVTANGTNTRGGVKLATTNFKGNKYNTVIIGVYRLAGTGFSSVILYTTSGHGETATFSLSIEMPPELAVVGGYAQLKFEMETQPSQDWVANDILSFRFGITPSLSTTDEFFITGIWVGRKAAPATNIDFKQEISVALAADVNDYAPTGYYENIASIRINVTAVSLITGLSGGRQGRVIILQNTGTQVAVITNEDTASVAVNRFALGRAIPIEPTGIILLKYDGTLQRWILLADTTSVNNATDFASPAVGGSSAGIYYDNCFGGTAYTALAGAANRLDISPYYVSDLLKTTELVINVTTGVASALARIVVYESGADGWPSNKVLESTSLDCGTTGTKTYTLGTTFYFIPGKKYWIGVHNSSTATIRAVALGASRGLCCTTSSSTQVATILRQTIAFGSAPATWTFATSQLIANVAPPNVRILKA